MGDLIAALVVLILPRTERCDALSALDVVREYAWSTADTGMLATIYVAGAGRTDVARLQAWRERAMRVEQMTMVRSSCRASGATSVEVVERLGMAVAVLPDGRRRSLPHDGWDRRIIDLQHRDGRWRILGVA